MPAGGKDVMIGLIHNVFWTEPKGYGPLYAHVRCAWAGKATSLLLMTSVWLQGQAPGGVLCWVLSPSLQEHVSQADTSMAFCMPVKTW